MRRSVLLSLVVLGSLISLVGSTGLFAALTDTASTGTNSVDSDALAASADIQLATASVASDGQITCGTYSENLTTPFFTASDVTEGWSVDTFFCLRNVGSQAVDISGNAPQLTDVDHDCTGDEALYDTTCGASGAGELSNVLWVAYGTADCSTSAISNFLHMPLGGNDTNPVGFVSSLAPGASGCFIARAYYPADFHTADVIQAAQSDTSTWSTQFVATLPI